MRSMRVSTGKTCSAASVVIAATLDEQGTIRHLQRRAQPDRMATATAGMSARMSRIAQSMSGARLRIAAE
jgi:hypothetical protein